MIEMCDSHFTVMYRPALKHKIKFQRTVEGMELEAHSFGFTLETHAHWMQLRCRTLPVFITWPA